MQVYVKQQFGLDWLYIGYIFVRIRKNGDMTIKLKESTTKFKDTVAWVKKPFLLKKILSKYPIILAFAFKVGKK
jgi:hypothetical protein